MKNQSPLNSLDRKDIALLDLLSSALALKPSDRHDLEHWWSQCRNHGESLGLFMVRHSILIKDALRTIEMVAKGYLKLDSIDPLLTSSGRETITTQIRLARKSKETQPIKLPASLQRAKAIHEDIQSKRGAESPDHSKESIRHASEQFKELCSKESSVGSTLIASDRESAKRVAPAVGTVLGKCLLMEQAGRGSSCIVYRAIHNTLKVQVAVKVLLPWTFDDPSQLQGFVEGEAQLLARLNHPAILRILDFDQEKGHPYLVLEYVDGLTLSQLIAQSGALQPKAALKITKQLAQGLDYARKHGVIHRDIKPGNILLSRDGQAKIADLGLAKVTSDEQSAPTLNNDAPIVGTPAYISPEQVLADKAVDFRSDIYSLGASLFEAVTGSRPFEAPTPLDLMLKHVHEEAPSADQFIPDLHPGLCSLIGQMLEKNPDKRVQSYEELIARFDAIIEDLDALRSSRRHSRATQSGSFWGSITSWISR